MHHESSEQRSEPGSIARPPKPTVAGDSVAAPRPMCALTSRTPSSLRDGYRHNIQIINAFNVLLDLLDQEQDVPSTHCA